MEIQSIPLGLRILIGFPIMAAAVYISEYFRRPEEFFIRRLRPSEGIQYTHVQLLFRAFIGVGLISVTSVILGISVIGYEDAPVELKRASIAIGLTIGLFLGLCSYLYFRIWRYVEIFPSGQADSDSGEQRVFIRRASPNPDTWGLRLTLIILFAAAIVALPIIGMSLTVIVSNLFG